MAIKDVFNLFFHPSCLDLQNFLPATKFWNSYARKNVFEGEQIGKHLKKHQDLLNDIFSTTFILRMGVPPKNWALFDFM